MMMTMIHEFYSSFLSNELIQITYKTFIVSLPFDLSLAGRKYFQSRPKI
jgi:hypothetical protein